MSNVVFAFDSAVATPVNNYKTSFRIIMVIF